MEFLAKLKLFPLSLHAFAALGLVVLLSYLISSKKDSSEPLYAISFPLIGHLVGIYRHGSDYFLHLKQRVGHGIYTISLFSGKIYVICAPEWVLAVHKHPKSLSFNELISNTFGKVFKLDRKTMDIVRHNRNGEDGSHSLLLETYDLTRTTLTHGPDLKEMTNIVINQEAERINSLSRGGKVETFMLWDWVRHNFTMASMNAVYGPKNPYAINPDLTKDFWNFDEHFLSLSLAPNPSLMIPKSDEARRRLFDAFAEYFQKDRTDQACTYIKKRTKLYLDRFGISKEMLGRLELSFNIAVLSNTIPTGFALLCFIFANPELLQDIRAEVDDCITHVDKNRAIINEYQLKSRCPLFVSTFREALRYFARINSGRIVVEDTQISNSATGESYLLKKGSMVQIMTDTLHFDPSIWGDQAHEFHAYRFLSQEDEDGTGSEQKKAVDRKPVDPAAPFRDSSGKLHSGAFRSFGSGSALCPGRHFAQSEMMALAAVFVAGFEMTDKDAETGFTMPALKRGFPVLAGVLRPAHDVEVTVRRRKGYENVDWAFET